MASAGPPQGPPPRKPVGSGAPPLPSNPEEVFGKIQGLIDKCLQMTLSREQTMAFIEREVHVDPFYTGLVWDKLVEHNPDYFRSYAYRLRLKQQITVFNRLLDQRIQVTKEEFDKIQMDRLNSHNKTETGNPAGSSSLHPDANANIPATSIPTQQTNGYNL